MPPTLDLSACRARQRRLADALSAQRLDAALITDPRHVFYLTGHWRVGRPIFLVAALLRADGRCALVAPTPVDSAAADVVETFASNRQGTLVEDQASELMAALSPHAGGLRRVGCDQIGPLWPPPQWEASNLAPALRAMRRAKDGDELAVLACAVRAAEAGYAWARRHAVPGADELAIYSGIAAAATDAVGEPIVELGNDFQSGALGGPPRRRVLERGEAFVLDVAVGVRGYASDLCRTFIVGAEPTSAQRDAHAEVMAALGHVESRARAGVSCKALHGEVHAMIDGKFGLSFPHHTGHGIGLSAHEAPRLNPHWDDTLAPGDVFTAEPGLYGEAIRVGVRVEEDYHVRADGSLSKLSSFPTNLLATG